MGVPSPRKNDATFKTFCEEVKKQFVFPLIMNNAQWNKLYEDYYYAKQQSAGIPGWVRNWWELAGHAQRDEINYLMPVDDSQFKYGHISDDLLHRYFLIRVWDNTLPIINYIMLNPSKADSIDDDPTTRKLIHYTKQEGYGGYVVTNLCSFRTPKPEILRQSYLNGEQVYDNETNIYTRYWLKHCDKHVLAWGNEGTWYPERMKFVKKLITQTDTDVFTFGMSAQGQPMHPLFLKKSLMLQQLPLENL